MVLTFSVSIVVELTVLVATGVAFWFVGKNSTTVFLTAFLVFGLSFSGYLTLSPSIAANTSESTVFDTFSSDEPWAGQHVRVNATLRSTPDAGNVTTISVIDENGRQYSTVEVTSGQTTVTLWGPTNQNRRSS